MAYLKSPCATSYRSSIATIALNCLVFEKIAFLHFGDRQTDQQTKCIGNDTKAAARQSLNYSKNKNKIKYGEKRFSIWRIEFLHPALWHDHDIDFVR